MAIDYEAARTFRVLNVFVLGHLIVSNQLYMRRRKLVLGMLDWMLLGMSICGIICIGMVAINISILPYTKTSPRSVFECNLFERSGNITHFLMFDFLTAFLYLKVLSIFKSMAKILGVGRTTTLIFHAGSVLAGIFFTLICLYIELFPLNDPNNCFFGTPAYTGHLISAAVVYCHVWFLSWFSWLLTSCIKQGASPNLIDIVRRCFVTTLLGTIMEVLAWEILSHYGSLSENSELWNEMLHVDIMLNTVLLTGNFADTKLRLTQIPFWNYHNLDEHYVSTAGSSVSASRQSAISKTTTNNRGVGSRPMATSQADSMV